MAALWVVALLLASSSRAIAQTDPGKTDPISTPERRSLFPDQHALIGTPLNVSTRSGSITLSDWARNPDASAMTVQDALVNGLQGEVQVRTAAGRILQQSTQEVAAAHFVGRTDEFQVDIVDEEGNLADGASVSFPAYSLNRNLGIRFVNSFGVATGELSTRIDEDGDSHREVVVCYPVNLGDRANVDFQMQVSVLDYTDLEEAGVVRTTAVGSHNLAGRLASSDLEYLFRRFASDSFISCEAGDFDGDGVDEVVMAYLSGLDGPLWVDVFRYTNDGETPAHLDRVGTPVGLEVLETPYVPEYLEPVFAMNVDVETGDFNADGRVDIAVASVVQVFAPGTNDFYPGIYVLSSDDDYALSLQSTFVTKEHSDLASNEIYTQTGSYGCLDDYRAASCEYMRAVLVSGLLRYDPDSVTGFDFNRRQLAVVFNMRWAQGGGQRVVALDVSDDLRTIVQAGETTVVPQSDCGRSRCNSSPRFAAGVGGYVGSADIANPLWSLMVSSWEATQGQDSGSSVGGQFRVSWLKPLAPGSVGGFELAQTALPLGAGPISGNLAARLPVVAWDREGNSVWLGSPVRLSVYDLIQADYIIQEPPKHALWWPPSATKAEDGQILNVSRQQNFYVELRDEESTDYSSTQTHQTDWTIGGSVAASSKATVTAGKNVVLAKETVTASLEVQAKVEYDYDENKSRYDSGYRSRTLTFTGQTNSDDYLVGDLLKIDIWRYPVSGIELDGGLNAFWEIAFPGKTIEVRAGGRNFDWYNPPHENGNILSYPQLSGASFTPEDCCAEFTYPDGSGEVTEAIPFLDPTLQAWDGTSGTIALNFSESSGEGSSRAYSHTLKESLDVKVGFKAEAEVLGQGLSVEGGIETSLSNSNSWSDVDTDSSNTNTSTGITLVKPDGNGNQAYFFMPQFYLAQDGTTKVTYAVDPLSAGSTYWPATYGRLPDAALNLPRRFSAVGGAWVVNHQSDAQRLRGFFVRYDTPDEAGDYPLVAGAVQDGEVLRMEAYVYNYSLAQGLSGLGVRFETVKYNPLTDQEVGERVPVHCTTGSITSLALDPRARKNAVCVWDTENFGPAIPGAIQYYRVYVVLDPDDTVEEIYEGTVGPGQNNQGWGLLAIAHPRLTYGMPVSTDEVPDGADISLSDDALALLVDGQLTTSLAKVVRGQLTPLRVCADTTQTQTGFHHVLVWQIDFDGEYTLLADKMLPGVDRGGQSCAWIHDLRLPSEGEYSLYAELLESDSDALLGNHTDVLAVDVEPVPAPQPAGQLGWASGVGTDGGSLFSRGRLRYEGDLDLSRAAVVIEQLLYELGGAGELVPGAFERAGQGLSLNGRVVDRGGRRAVFETPGGDQPQVRLDLQRVGAWVYVTLRVEGAVVLEPELCGRDTELTTRIFLLDDDSAPVQLDLSAEWVCYRGRRGQVRQLGLLRH